MDPVSLVVGALAAGASDTARQAVTDSYDGLKQLLLRRFSGDRAAEVALTGHEADPDRWRLPLAEALEQTGAATDAEVLAAAQVVIDLVGSDARPAGKYRVDVKGARGVQVGDRNHQVNVFDDSPRRKP
jgi:hypothetical protein